MKVLLFFLLLFSFSLTFSQVEYFVTINPNSGTYNKVAQIPNVQRVYVNPCFDALNTLDGHYTFRGGPSDTVTFLVTVEVETGVVLYNPSYPSFDNPQSQIAELQYNNSNGKLYALYQNGNNLQLYLTEVNPINASFVIIDSFPTITSVSSCAFTTFNSVDGHYIFSGQNAGGISKLYSVDVLDGTIVYQPDFPPSGGGYFSGFHYHQNEQVLYGLYRNLADSMFLISVNPQTGVFTPKGHIPNIEYIDGNESAIDIVHGHYIFKTPVVDSVGNTVFRLYSVRLSDAGVEASPEYPHTSDTQDNFIQIQYDPIRESLYALHWDFNLTGIFSQGLAQAELFPNPVESEFTLRVGEETGKEIHYCILDSNGKIQLENTVPYRSALSINTEKIPSGIYILKAENGNRSFSEIFVVK